MSFDDAIDQYQKALDIYRLKDSDSENLDTAEVRNNMGQVYSKQCDYKNAEECYNKALKIRTKILGDNHATVADVTNNLANLFVSQNRFDEAETCYQRALNIYEDVDNGSKLNCAEVLDNMGHLCLQLCQYDKAEECFKKALDIRLKLSDGNYYEYSVVESLKCFGKLFVARERFNEADACYYMISDIYTHHIKDENQPEFAMLFDDMGHFYFKQKNYCEAEKYFRKSAKYSNENVLISKHIEDSEVAKQSWRSVGCSRAFQQS